MSLLGLVGCGIPSGADGPQRLIGEDETLQPFFLEICQAANQLPIQYRFGQVSFPLFQSLPDAQDDLQPGIQGGPNFMMDEGVALAKLVAALAVSEDDVPATGV